MGIIYKIENNITHQIYIGQTRFDLQKRWLEHIKEAQEALNGTRQSFPLFHRMIIKYGEENFVSTVLEECDNQLLDNREQYWINYFDSMNKGYNSTIGGKTASLVDKSNHSHKVSQFTLDGKFIQTFFSAQDAAEKVNVDASNIRKNCNAQTTNSAGYLWQWGDSQIFSRDINESTRKKTRAIAQYDKNGILINTFQSIADGARAVKGNYINIYNNCHGKSITAYGFVWKFIDE